VVKTPRTKGLRLSESSGTTSLNTPDAPVHASSRRVPVNFVEKTSLWGEVSDVRRWSPSSALSTPLFPVTLS